MDYTIEGKLAQTVRLRLKEGEKCWASRGSLMSLDEGIEWTLKVPGGIGGAGRRMLSGEGISLILIEGRAGGGEVILSSHQPGKVIAWNLDESPALATRGSFIGAVGPSVDIDVRVARRAGAALFGGTGLFLQKLSGQGLAFIHGAGDFIEHDLAAGQSILVSTGNLAAFGDSVDYDVKTVGGLRRIFFGGEGLFMTRLTGPGKVLLQSLKRETGTQGRRRE
jgi:uncharacterized protein (TIGR00266 family)